MDCLYINIYSVLQSYISEISQRPYHAEHTAVLVRSPKLSRVKLRLVMAIPREKRGLLGHITGTLY